MNSESPEPHEANPLKSLDDLCDEFESAWQRGDEPSLTDFLPRVPQPQKGAAFRELLALELEYLGDAGRVVDGSDYRERFPEFARDIDQVLSTFARGTTDHPDASQSDTLPLSDMSSGDVEAIPGSSNSRGGRYRIVELHAKGGLGEVFVAEDTELKRKVALKEIQARFSGIEESRTRFLREATITGGLEHPGIVPVYGLGSYEDGRPFYAMRFVKGETLLDAINGFHCENANVSVRSTRRLELRKLLRHFVDVCNAIDYAHSKGVIHRDLKPANVMLGKHGETLVVDWGLAKTLDLAESTPGNLGDSIFVIEPSHDSAPTQMGSVMGTPAYMSPEQAAGDTARQGTASDVYSLGATLYHLLTGTAPFTVGKDILESVQAGRFPRPRDVESRLPKPLEAISLKAMSLKTENRYESAASLADDVEKWLGDEPLNAYRETIVQQCMRWCRRHRTVAAATAVAVVLLGFAASVVYVQSQRSAQREAMRQAEIRNNNLRHQQELQQREDKRIATLRFTALANQQSALSQLRADAFTSSAAILDDTLSNLPELMEVRDIREELEAQSVRASQLIRFDKLVDNAWFFAGENKYNLASKVCQEALSDFGVDDHEEWWMHLPTAELTEGQQDRIAREVHRLMLLQASMLARDAIMDLSNPERKTECEQALRILAKAQTFEATHFSRLVEAFCHFRLGQHDKIKPLKSIEPASPADFFLFGFVYWYVAKVPDDAASSFVVNMVRRIAGLEFTDPWSKAYECFREAAVLEPERYWNHYTLAWFMIEAGDWFHAEMALNACLALRPELGTTYAVRGVSLMKQGKQLDDDKLIKKGEQSFERALDLARDANDRMLVHALRRSELYAVGKSSEALDDVFRLVELYPANEQYRAGFENLLRDCQLLLNEDSSNLKAHASRALIFLKLEDFDKAQQEAETLFDLAEKHLVGLTVRGTCRLQRAELKAALEDFDNAVNQDAKCFLAVIGRALSLERMDRDGDALEAFELAQSASETNWQRIQALEGQARSLEKLGRDAELSPIRQQIIATTRAVEMGDL